MLLNSTSYTAPNLGLQIAEEGRHNPDDPGFAFFAQGGPSISWQKHLSLLQRRKKLDRLEAAQLRVDPDAPLEERWEDEKLVERCRIDVSQTSLSLDC